MDAPHTPHERWIWTELIGFDNRLPDHGVGEYLEATGFVPDAICLLITSPDFALSHEAVAEEVELPPDFCSRDGHERNPQRQRQVWTNHQLRALIAQLHERDIQVYLTMFTRFYGNRFHHEWVSDHREVCMVFRGHGWVSSINCLSRLADGSYFEDYWGTKLSQVLDYYGFDGWHGADGYGPLNGAIYQVCLSDDMVDQFADTCDIELPLVVTGRCNPDPDKLEARAEWLWRHARREWVEFYANRWAGFWQKVVAAVHAVGKKAVINSAWGRAPFESLYRYGIDYRRIAAAGVDGIIVETVAAGLSMDPRPGAADPSRHHDFLSMLMLIKACVPDQKLIFLHNVHDTVEEWDAIHHKPPVLEREIYSLPNVFHVRSNGELQPCADGFLACLGDGLSAEEWAWLRERWDLAFSDQPRRALGATLIWSDAVLDAQTEDFITHRSWTVHRLLFHLMARGAPVQAVANVRALDAVRGPILVINPHLMPADELAKVAAYDGGPAIVIGPEHDSPVPPGYSFGDTQASHPVRCSVYGAAPGPAPEIEVGEAHTLPEDVMGIKEPTGYWDHMTFRPVSPGFLDACAATILRVAGIYAIGEGAEDVCVMATETADGLLRLAIKNKTPFYARPRIDLPEPIESVSIVTPFPSVLVAPDESGFSVRVPPDGITVVDVTLRARSLAGRPYRGGSP